MLSATAQHAIRALVQLAKAPGPAPLLGRDLADLADIPANFLAKIMLTFRNAGYVEATRGLGGGYRLLKQPEAIRLMEIVQLFDGVTAGQPSCFLGERHACNESEACAAHSGWKHVWEAYLTFLTNKTIADLSHGTSGPRGLGTVPLAGNGNARWKQ